MVGVTFLLLLLVLPLLFCLYRTKRVSNCFFLIFALSWYALSTISTHAYNGTALCSFRVCVGSRRCLSGCVIFNRGNVLKMFWAFKFQLYFKALNTELERRVNASAQLMSWAKQYVCVCLIIGSDFNNYSRLVAY